MKIILSLIFLFLLNSSYLISAPFYWEYIDVKIDIQENGDMIITEKQKYKFLDSYTNKRYRYIPLDKIEKIKNVSVSEDNKKIPHQTGIEKNQFWIRWTHALNPPESHTFKIEYRIIGGLQKLGNNEMLYWKVIFADRVSEVRSAKILVTLPQSLSGKVISFTSFGVASSEKSLGPNLYEFNSLETIAPKSELEIQIVYPAGIIGN